MKREICDKQNKSLLLYNLLISIGKFQLAYLLWLAWKTIIQLILMVEEKLKVRNIYIADGWFIWK